jgi:hypothetical protein
MYEYRHKYPCYFVAINVQFRLALVIMKPNREKIVQYGAWAPLLLPCMKHLSMTGNLEVNL